MTILVTGAAGFLGRALMWRLAEGGRAVLGTARTATDGVLGCDLSDPAALSALLDRVRPTAIVHAAATVDFRPGALAATYAVNVLAPGLIAGWAARAGAHLVFCSSIAVHGGRCAAIDSQTAIAPDGDYGRAKALAEQMVTASGAAAAILRLPGIYGRRGPTHLSLNRALDGAAVGQVPVLTGPGTGRRNYVHVDDAAAMIAAAVDGRLTGVHAVAGGETLSLADWLQAVCDRWLPGRQPECRVGDDCPDQVVVGSSALPAGRSVAAVLAGES